MRINFRRLTVYFICFSLLCGLSQGCVKRPFGKPSGTFVGSCRGTMKLTSGERTRFAVDVFKTSEDDFNAYLSLSRKRVKYALIENFSFEDDTIKIEIKSPNKIFEGKIVGDSLKFEGEWGKYQGSLILKLKD